MTDTPRYAAVAITLHWVIALLMIGMVFLGWYMEDLRDLAFAGGNVSLERVQAVYNTHKTIGLFVLGFSLFRLYWRLTHKTPPLPDGMMAWERFAATATHWLFYALMIGMPIGGWIAASASPYPTLLFNEPGLELIKLPVPQNEAFESAMGSAHGAGGWAILALVGLHVGAALKHQFINKDGLIGRMIPLKFLKG